MAKFLELPYFKVHFKVHTIPVQELVDNFPIIQQLENQIHTMPHCLAKKGKIKQNMSPDFVALEPGKQQQK